MKTFTPLSAIATLALVLSAAQAQTPVTILSKFNRLDKLVPDGSAIGVADSQTLDLPGLETITDLKVSLTLDGGFNGDLYCYLLHDSGFVVLLNRPGRCATNSTGYEDAGLKAVFSRQASTDSHFYGGKAANDCSDSIEYAPDGRKTDPQKTVGTEARTTSLDSFVGLNPSGKWTLFVADLCNSGEQTILKDWALEITAKPAQSLQDPAIATASIAKADVH